MFTSPKALDRLDNALVVVAFVGFLVLVGSLWSLVLM